LRRIVINMKNALFCNAVSETLRRSENDFDTYTVDTPDKVADECRWLDPYALLMEVTGCQVWQLSERLKIRDEVKAKQPDCRIVLIVDENAEKDLARQVKQAKKDGLIDQFVYSSISAAYLADVVDTL